MSDDRQPDIQAALFDIDGTLTTGGPVWKALITSPDVPVMRKMWLYGTAFPHYMLSKARVLDQAAFRDRWVRLMAWLMTGWSAAQVDDICDEIVSGMLAPNLRADVVELLRRHQAQGHAVILVSTMFERIVARLAEQLDADAGLGSVVTFANGTCSGKIAGQTCSGGRKIDFVRHYLAQRKPAIGLEACVAYADSASDIPFLEGAGVSVAVYPDDAMRAAAEARHWEIYDGA